MSEREVDEVLRGATRCLLATAGAEGPELSPCAFWADGRALWLSVPSRGAQATALRAEPACAVYLPPPRPSGPAVLAHGAARVHAIDDPLGLLLHGPTISTAVAALAVKQTAAAVGSRGLPRLPPLTLPAGRAVVRIELRATTLADLPEPGPGVAPGLPGIVPADVRRALAGRRRVVLALSGDEPRIAPAVWSAGYALGTADQPFGPEGGVAAVCVDADETGGLQGDVTLTLRGQLRRKRLEPDRATWWRGRGAESAEVPAEVPGAVELPD